MIDNRKIKKALSPRFEGSAPQSGIAHFNGVSGAITLGSDDDTFGYTIKNNMDRPVLLALSAGYMDTLPHLVKNLQGINVDAVLTEGVVFSEDEADVTCYGDPKSVDEFLAFVKLNPVAFRMLKLRVDDASQFEQNISVQRISPFGMPSSNRIAPGVHKDAKQTNDRLVDIPLDDLQMDSQTVLTYTVAPGREVSFTWFVQASNNASNELRKVMQRLKKPASA
jgi:hypothetical protein